MLVALFVAGGLLALIVLYYGERYREQQERRAWGAYWAWVEHRIKQAKSEENS